MALTKISKPRCGSSRSAGSAESSAASTPERIASDDFTAADIMMAGVLRTIRKTDLMQNFPRLQAYFERCFARPAWERALSLTAERLGMKVDDIR